MKKIIDFISSILGFASTLASIISFFSESTSLIVSILLLGCSIILLVFIPLIVHHFSLKKAPNIADNMRINALDLIENTFQTNNHLVLEKERVDITICKCYNKNVGNFRLKM